MSEHNEAVSLANWLAWKNLEFWHLNQEMWTPSWNQKRKQKLEGSKKGIPDYLIIIPAERSTNGRQLTLWLELKKPKKQLQRNSIRGKKGDFVPDNDATPEQLKFLEMINKSQDTAGKVCYGFDESIEFVEKHIKSSKKT